MTDNPSLRDLLTPVCPLGTADQLILEWIAENSLFRVKQVGRYYIDVCPLLVNHRLCTTYVDSPNEYDRFWCYVGWSQTTWMAAVLAGAMWDGSDETEPMGWNKSGQTQEWREPGTGQTWQTSRAVEVMVEALKYQL